MSRKARKFKAFFRPKSGDLQKKKKKKRSSPKFRVIFRPKSEVQRFFLPKIRCSPQKKKKKRSLLKVRPVFNPDSLKFPAESLMPNLQRGGPCLNFAHFTMQFCNPSDPKGGAIMEWKKITSMEHGKSIFHSIPCSVSEFIQKFKVTYCK